MEGLSCMHAYMHVYIYKWSDNGNYKAVESMLLSGGLMFPLVVMFTLSFIEFPFTVVVPSFETSSTKLFLDRSASNNNYI